MEEDVLISFAGALARLDPESKEPVEFLKKYLKPAKFRAAYKENLLEAVHVAQSPALAPPLLEIVKHEVDTLKAVEKPGKFASSELAEETRGVVLAAAVWMELHPEGVDDAILALLRQAVRNKIPLKIINPLALQLEQGEETRPKVEKIMGQKWAAKAKIIITLRQTPVNFATLLPVRTFPRLCELKRFF